MAKSGPFLIPFLALLPSNEGILSFGILLEVALSLNQAVFGDSVYRSYNPPGIYLLRAGRAIAEECSIGRIHGT